MCGKKLVSMTAKRHFIRYTQGLFACSMLPLALSLAVTGAPPRAGRTFWHAERTSNEEYGCEQAATPLRADQGCGAARARGATSLGHDHGPGGLYGVGSNP
jgi:hypothetical protein